MRSLLLITAYHNNMIYIEYENNQFIPTPLAWQHEEFHKPWKGRMMYFRDGVVIEPLLLCKSRT